MRQDFARLDPTNSSYWKGPSWRRISYMNLMVVTEIDCCILGLVRGYIELMEKKMETTILYHIIVFPAPISISA